MDYTLLLYHMVPDTLHTLRPICSMCNQITKDIWSQCISFSVCLVMSVVDCIVSYKFSNELTVLVLFNYVRYSNLYRNGAVDVECVFDSPLKLLFETFFTPVNT